jgi:23S rRNA (adenine2503-C2)-methyltransferase
VNDRPLIYDLGLGELEAWAAAQGEPAYRARQVWDWLYLHLANGPEQMTNLPSRLRRQLADSYSFGPAGEPVSQTSSDGHTEKVLLVLDAETSVETVLMRYRTRRTACISTQAGCGMGCVFCATGQMGLMRNLSAGEIVLQVLEFERQLRPGGERLTNVVIMGMGEPFHNYASTVEAVDRLSDPAGLSFSPRRVTISTVGLVPALRRYTQEDRRANLAVSLHAATDELRNELVPINRRYPLQELFEACREYVGRSGRRLSFEWALIQDLNDTPEQARALLRWLRGLTCHVNLIPLNPTAGFNGGASSGERAREFQRIIRDAGISCTVRLRRGIDIQAGCGQLATEARAGASPSIRLAAQA